ncbi:hypothetical protein B4168_1880 [Anoxybacillus flavithermus]|nr:hypothetical protein B4168_1880 [Anoxybacillus flavithermus]OAO85536.1 hypothetical protein GT23_2439 [Parageobacillus thermoglucosidasius]
MLTITDILLFTASVPPSLFILSIMNTLFYTTSLLSYKENAFYNETNQLLFPHFFVTIKLESFIFPSLAPENANTILNGTYLY